MNGRKVVTEPCANKCCGVGSGIVASCGAGAGSAAWQRVAEVVAPDEEIAGVDNSVAVAVGVGIGVAVVLPPDGVVGGVDVPLWS